MIYHAMVFVHITKERKADRFFPILVIRLTEVSAGNPWT